MTTKTKTKLVTTLIAFTLFSGAVSAVPELDAVSFDPGFVSAGDSVNISANMHETGYPDKVWDGDKRITMVLKPGNRLAREHSIIVDDRDKSIGFLYPEGVWNQNYRVKIDSDAPTGNYRYKIHIIYTSMEENSSFIKEFNMPVDKEGIDLSATTLNTDPRQPRPGDNYVTQKIQITNTGNKPVEEIQVIPQTDEFIQAAYSEDEKFYIGRINPGESSVIDLGLQLDQQLAPARYSIGLKTSFEDTDSNQYEDTLNTPIRIDGKPDLELVDKEFMMNAGETSELHIEIKNTGSQDAESATARLLAERTQPFSLADRSDYIGEIEAGETAEAVLKISSERSATLKQHELKVELRASGDSEEGDRSIYTFTEGQSVSLEGRTSNPLIYIGGLGSLVVLGWFSYSFKGGKKNED